jgi:hypothetical protein
MPLVRAAIAARCERTGAQSSLDGTPTDPAIIEDVKRFAKLAQSHVVLLHVGWMGSRTYGPDAVSPEIAEDTAYLEKVRTEFHSVGIP